MVTGVPLVEMEVVTRVTWTGGPRAITVGVPREGVQDGPGLGRVWPEVAQDTGQSPARGVWEAGGGCGAEGQDGHGAGQSQPPSEGLTV